MGITNIRHPEDLLKGYHSARTCIIPDLGRRLILSCIEGTETDLARYAALIARGASDKWISAVDFRVEIGHPGNFPTPMIQFCRYFDEFKRLTKQETEKVGVAFFIVVEGVEGAALSKLVVREDIQQVATQAFLEAANGYSVVFSGLLRRDSLSRLGSQGLTLRKATGIDEFLGLEDGQAAGNAEPVVAPKEALKEGDGVIKIAMPPLLVLC